MNSEAMIASSSRLGDQAGGQVEPIIWSLRNLIQKERKRKADNNAALGIVMPTEVVNPSVGSYSKLWLQRHVGWYLSLSINAA